MKSSFIQSILLYAAFLQPFVLKAQVDVEEPSIEEPAAIPSAASGAPAEVSQKENFINLLKTDVEPHMLKGDIDKINHNVMRLGSYRREWVQSGRDFLIANSPVSELYLYRYSLVKNQRLNAEILETLLAFPSYRYPRAALSFADALGETESGKRQMLRLFQKVIAQDPSIAKSAFELVSSAWGRDLSTVEKLEFTSNNCAAAKILEPQQRQLIDTWRENAESFWEGVMSVEVSACLRGV